VVVLLRGRVFVACFTVGGLTYLVATGVGVWGHANPVKLGVGHRQLRLLDRYRPPGTLISAILCLLRRNGVRQSIARGGDDDFCRDLRGDLPGLSRRPRVVRLVSFPAPKFEHHLAELPFAARVGRIRRFNLRNGVRALLVPRLIPTSPVLRDRFYAWATNSVPSSTVCCHGLAWLQPALEQYDGVFDSGRHLHALVLLHDRFVRLRGFAVALAGITTIFPPYFVAAPSSPALGWCSR